MKPFTVLKILLLLAIATGLLFFAFKGINVSEVFGKMKQANLFWLFLSFALSFIALISRAYRWNLLIEPLGYSPKLKNTTYAVSIGYFANLAFPRLGEVTRCGTLGRAESIPFSSLLGTVIVERIVDVITLFICLILAAIIEFRKVSEFLSPRIQNVKRFLISPIGIIVMVVVIIFIVLGIYYFKKKQQLKGKESPIVHFFNELIKGIKSIANLNRPWQFIFQSFFIWGLYFLSAYVCFFALPATSHLGLKAALVILTLGAVGMTIPLPGGTGSYHILVSQGLMLYGLSKEDGLSFATLLHGLQLLMIVLVGSISLFLLFLENKKARNKIEGTSSIPH
jgi:uncharacterized protein (TIRG00374 family)